MIANELACFDILLNKNIFIFVPFFLTLLDIVFNFIVF